MRRAPVALLITFASLALVLAVVLLRPPGEVASPSPSPSPTATASATPTATAAASPSPSPSPTPQGLYMSKKLGFALTLTPPWRPATCGSSDPVDTRLPAIEQFTDATVMNEFIGETGSPNHRVEVYVEDNPRNQSAMEFTAGRSVVGGTPRPATFLGRPVAEIGDAAGPGYGYVIPEGGRMYTVLYRRSNAEIPFDPAPMTAIVRSFRFLTAAERQSLPDATPIPASAPTAQALAGMLKTAFDAKDTAALERLLSPCVHNGVQNGGGSAMPRERYISLELRPRFTRGLTVTVDTNAIRTDALGSGDTFVRSRWTEPGQQPQNIDLMLGTTRGGLFWRGTLVSFSPPG